MEQQRIDMFLMQNAEKFNPFQLEQIKEALTKLDDSKAPYILGLELKEPSTMLIFAILLGMCGVDRFMLGEAGLGVLKIITCGGFYIWWIVDIVNIKDRTRDYNFNKMREALMTQGVSIFR